MKIALIGYGKMGHAIEKIALQRGHEIVAHVDVSCGDAEIDSDAFRSADVAIEFTTPATAFGNITAALAEGIPVVCGTTGWTSRIGEIKAICDSGNGTFFWTSNFSLGVNMFFAVNRYLAALMAGFPQYRPSMKEIHHIHKLDHPSGTALTLAEGIMEEDPRIGCWSESIGDDNTLLIGHEREGEVPGTHIITWDSPVDTITIEHRAKSREGFALGAVVAAEWIKDRKGFLTMPEMMEGLVSDASLLKTVGL